MALAGYFSKDLIAINRLIDTDQNELKTKLDSILITLAFDDNAVNTTEGLCGLDLIVRLLARFYPKLKIVDLSDKNEERRKELIELARKINHKIDIIADNVDEDFYLVAGSTDVLFKTTGNKIYFGSDNWISKYSTSRVQEFCDSGNPFGVGVAACITASNIFRIIFNEPIKKFELDDEVEISVYNLNKSNKIVNPEMGEKVFDDVIIAGIGAIGNGAIWALSKLKRLKGDLHLVDHEKIELTNLQRYVLFFEKDINKIKVNIAKKSFTQKDLSVTTTNGKWANYVFNRNSWDIKCVAVGIDNVVDRIGIQSSLPKIIFNAFTEPEAIGISRHKDFVKEACLACSYINLNKKKDLLNEIADNCNISDKYEIVKHYYNTKISVDMPFSTKNNDSLLSIIADANGIELKEFSNFKGMKIEQFYSRFVCGGIILKLSNTKNEIKNVDAPLAFQSAMAGILLAAEMVKYSIEPSLIQEQRTDFYHLFPVKGSINPYHRTIEKDQTMHCLCRDNDFITRFNAKWK